MSLSPEAVLPRLRGGLGRTYIYLPAVASTNRWLLERARRHPLPEGTVVVTDHQWAGRGRRGRRWWAPPGQALPFSLLLRPPARAPLGLLGAALALGVVDGVRAHLGLDLALKWPNDLLLAGRKVGGILVEGFWGVDPPLVVAGIGLNVNVEAFPPELEGRAASLAQVLGRKVDRGRLLAALLAALEGWLDRWRRGEDLRPAWRRRLVGLGEPVEVHAREGTFSGTFQDVAEDGALLLRLPSGQVQPIYAGEVSLRLASLPY